MSSTESSVIQPRRIALLGATGSIGSQALEIIEGSKGRLRAEILSAHTGTQKLVEAANRIHPATIILTDPSANRAPLSDLDPGIEVLYGAEALNDVVQRPEVDIVLSAIVGGGGFASLCSALEAGKRVALANKESLVLGGGYLQELQERFGGRLIPIDSEHSAIYQCLQARQMDPKKMRGRESYHSPLDSKSQTEGLKFSQFVEEEVFRLILTASGGPFRERTAEELRTITVEEALCHPTWKMGRKITIDSATLMNKAFEMVEARWLFDLPVEKLSVVLHPQSIVHSMVEFIDGAVLAQMSVPDMRIPIQLALTEPFRFEGQTKRLDWTQMMQLDFLPPDPDRFPALALGNLMVKLGGTAGVVVNAANEVAVDAFLNHQLTFDRIVFACKTILDNHDYNAHPSFSDLYRMDHWARQETLKFIRSES